MNTLTDINAIHSDINSVLLSDHVKTLPPPTPTHPPLKVT